MLPRIQWRGKGTPILLACVLLGCGGNNAEIKGRSKVVPVQGTVMYQGAPLAGAVVMFHAEAAELTASGLTNEQGVFQLRTYDKTDGAVPGTHKVTVKKVEVKTVPHPDDVNLGPISSEEIWHTPKKYATPAETPLTITVGEQGEKNLAITLDE
ncbi:MAG: carboxypeptidase-like regulatory domain-containing protein [Planctomycetaceae bacterium]|nr:carboxypeptidase regulatory-like domain-containing protein [Planctomycetaceae bacterium]